MRIFCFGDISPKIFFQSHPIALSIDIKCPRKYIMLPADSFDIFHQPNLDLSDISMLLARIDFSISEMFNILQEIAVDTRNHIKK